MLLVIDCGPAPSVDHSTSATTRASNTTYGTTVSYACDIGYKTGRPSSVRCLITGVWSLPTPICDGKCYMYNGYLWIQDLGKYISSIPQ